MPPPAAPFGGPAAAFPVTWAEYRATAVLLAFFVANILLAVLFARPFSDAHLQAFQDPQAVSNSLVYIAMILAFTFVILWIAKRGKKWLIQLIILAAVGSTILVVLYPLLALLPIFQTELAVAWSLDFITGAVVAGGLVFALYKHPEWYVVDAVGLLVAAASAAMFGISLGLIPVLVLLTALAVYDAIAVYKTKHMLSLADSVLELRLPVLLVIPKHAGYSFLAEGAKFKEAKAETKGEREAMFMGLGDLVMPTILVVSALTFALPAWGSLPALGAAVGTLVGFGVLMGFVLKGNPQAGLPLLNGGAIVGFLSGIFAATGSLRFW